MLTDSDFVAAPLAQDAERRRSLAISGSTALSTTNGFWARDGERFVNVRAPLAGDDLRDVYVYEFDERHELQRFIHAKSATSSDDGWQLHDAVESRLSAMGDTTRRRIDTPLGDFISRKQIELLVADPAHLSISDLYRSIRSLEDRGENAGRYELAFWKRITMPFASVAMLLLSVPLVLVASPRARMGQRVAAGALLGIVFKMFDETFGQFGLVYGMSPVIAAIAPSCLAFLVAVWLMRETT